MNSRTPIVRTMLVALTSWFSDSAVAADPPPTGQTFYPAGSRQSFDGPEKLFTGDVRVDMLFPDNDTAHYSGAYVTFQPGARTAWHLHPAGQHMIVTKGVALTGTRDGKVIEFREGETVWCPANVDHWHGATAHAAMTHLVITGSRDGENVIWKEKVTEAEYYAGQRKKAKTAADAHALSAGQRAIVPIAALTANGNLASLKTAIRSGLDAGLSVNEIKEVQIHLYAYVGFPRTLNGLSTLMAVLDERKAEGIADPPGRAPNPFPEGMSSLEVGKAVQTELAGRPVSGPLFDFAPDINQFLQRHLFGDLFARGILDYQGREIATVSALASLDGVDSQLKSHIAIATNVGLTAAQLTEVAAVLGEAVGDGEGHRAEQAVRAVLSE
ncbi:MAG: carboxymuconolactone decarboxylase family protein [Gammaproteobacteria bacterium]|nr:carboxymuconolactone decarboxylase family protein [Gammaproteobacteria bacterium]